MDNYGGPVWHASGKGKNPRASRTIARDALRGVGDSALGEWSSPGERAEIVHVQRRLSAEEIELFGVPEPIDVRGTQEESRRVLRTIVDAPYLLQLPTFGRWARLIAETL